MLLCLSLSLKIHASSNQRSRADIRMMHTQRGVLTSDFLFFRPGKIILALLRCSLQSLGEYLKRPDQSASGQFHQHLNTRLLFLREPFYLSFPFSASLLQSSFLSLSLFLLFAFPDLPKQPPALWISLRELPASEKSRGKRDARAGRAGWEVFKSVG